MSEEEKDVKHSEAWGAAPDGSQVDEREHNRPKQC